MGKGKIAEKIVSEMFIEAGFKVIKYGYEHTVPELANRDNLIKGDAAFYIRHQPDFIIVNNNNEAFFIEVKFRRGGVIHKKEMFNYPNCYVIFLTKDNILGQRLSEIYRHGENFKLLRNIAPFANISETVISKYVRITRRKLGDENLVGQLVEKFVEKLINKPFRQPNTQTIIIGNEKPKTMIEANSKINSARFQKELQVKNRDDNRVQRKRWKKRQQFKRRR